MHMKSDELAGEHRHHHHHGHRHHRRRRRHKRFHVRPEAKGVGYWKFLGVPSRSRRAAEADINMGDEADEIEETQGGSFWTLAVIVVCAIVLFWLLGEQILRVLWRIVPH
jgi:hypothetical protein